MSLSTFENIFYKNSVSSQSTLCFPNCLLALCSGFIFVLSLFSFAFLLANRFLASDVAPLFLVERQSNVAYSPKFFYISISWRPAAVVDPPLYPSPRPKLFSEFMSYIMFGNLVSNKRLYSCLISSFRLKTDGLRSRDFYPAV